MLGNNRVFPPCEKVVETRNVEDDIVVLIRRRREELELIRRVQVGRERSPCQVRS